MAAIVRLVKRDPSLTPLFVAVGGGIIAAVGISQHYLRTSPDVSINKKKRPEPWNDVEQHQNTKFKSYNPDFWASRKDHPNPRAVFHSPAEDESAHTFAASASSAVQQAKERAAAKAKESTMARFEQEGQSDSVRTSGADFGKERAVEH
ncbi:hypothetical protein JCM10450v2_008117 [Rhodotorula kratochvilovae]